MADLGYSSKGIGRRGIGSRISLLFAASLAHIIAVVLMTSTTRRAPVHIERGSPALTLLLLPERPERPHPLVTTPKARANRVRTPKSRTTRLPTQPDEPAQVAQPTEESTRSIDWQAEAEREGQKQQEDRWRSLDSPSSSAITLSPKSPKAPEFHWDNASTHRVQALPTGGTLIRLNDHCVITWVGLPFGGCALGKIPARGDLFEHMNDPPPLGDSKDR